MISRTIAILGLSMIFGVPGARADDEPHTYDLWFDGELAPHPANPKDPTFVEGDTIYLHVDPTRRFPDSKTQNLELGFAAQAAPLDVLGFYVVGPSAGRGKLIIQPGVCPDSSGAEATLKAARAKLDALQAQKAPDADLAAARKAVDDAQAAFKHSTDVALAPTALECEPANDWPLDNNDLRPYVCAKTQTIAALIKTSTTWSFAERTNVTGVASCLTGWTLQAGRKVAKLEAYHVDGGNAAEAIPFLKQTAVWNATMVVKRGARIIDLIASYESADATVSRTLEFTTTPRDTHSRVRLEAEVLATNRVRTISMAFSVTPVSRRFFTDGPSLSCVLLCAITPHALFRLSGDNKTIVQLGFGLGLNLSQAFQFNGGFLFGTADANTTWRDERNWYIGVAVDPLIISEMLSSAAKKE